MIKRTAMALVSLALMLLPFAVYTTAVAEGSTSEIRGTVADPTGAVIPAARLGLKSEGGASASTVSGRDGSFSFTNLQPGKYSLVITAKGFAQTTLDEIEVLPGKILQQNVTLELPVEQQQVEVKEYAVGVSTSADNNASSIVIKGK